MKSKANMTLEEAIAQEKGQLSQIVLKFTKVMKDILDSAKNNPKFSVASWAPLTQMVDTKTFERVGIFKEVVNWQEYADLLTSWATRSSWEFRIRRISEQPGCVFLELEEFSHYKESSDAIYSLSVYEFGDGTKLRHLDVYMQRTQGQKFDSETWNVSKNRT
jgi:hypothetical protein